MTAPDAAPPVADEGLRCLECEYNLTGLTSDRCPECGTVVDWPAVRADRDGLDDHPGTCWERWPWRWKPIGFVVTAFHAALMPWALARQLRNRPRLGPTLVFLFICLATLVMTWKFVHHETEVAMCLIGIVCQVFLQTQVFWPLLPPHRSQRSWRFWLAVSAYTSWPVLVEGFGHTPPPLILWNETDVWPFPTGSLPHNVVTTVLFYIWWVDLVVIAFVRVPRRFWWRIVLAVLAIPVLVFMSSYTGCYMGGKVSGNW